MSAKVKFFLLFLPLTAIGVAATLLFYPKNNGLPYRIVVEKGQGISAVSRKLADDKKVYSRPVLMAAAYFLGVHDKLTNGSYRLPARVSAWEILQKLQKNSPDSVRVQIVEGMRFSQMRRVVNQMDNIRHDTKNMTDEELLHKVTPNPFRQPRRLVLPRQLRNCSRQQRFADFQSIVQSHGTRIERSMGRPRCRVAL